jgi:hypothetical protein
MNMPADPTLDLDLAAVLDESRRLAASITPDSGPWDARTAGTGENRKLVRCFMINHS